MKQKRGIRLLNEGNNSRRRRVTTAVAAKKRSSDRDMEIIEKEKKFSGDRNEEESRKKVELLRNENWERGDWDRNIYNQCG